MGKKITMFSTESSSIQERFEQYLSAASAKGLSSKTLKTYRQHFHCISKHLDITVPLSSLSRAQVDAAIVSMRNSGLSANSISSYLRAFIMTNVIWMTPWQMSNGKLLPSAELFPQRNY